VEGFEEIPGIGMAADSEGYISPVPANHIGIFLGCFPSPGQQPGFYFIEILCRDGYQRD